MRRIRVYEIGTRMFGKNNRSSLLTVIVNITTVKFFLTKLNLLFIVVENLFSIFCKAFIQLLVGCTASIRREITLTQIILSACFCNNVATMANKKHLLLGYSVQE